MKQGDLRGLKQRLQTQLDRLSGQAFDPADPKHFTRWLKAHPIPSANDVQRVWFGVEQPNVSILMPVYNVQALWLRQAIESVLSQHYSAWELCIVNDASTDAHIAPLLDDYAQRDSRIKVIHAVRNQGISGATQRALEAASSGFIALLDNDDVLFPHALHVMMQTQRSTNADWIYSDFVMRDGDALSRPFFKPDYSPERLMAQMYVNHFQVMRRALVHQVGGFRAGFDGSQDYDLALRLMEASPTVAHAPWPLYQWRAVPGSTAVNYRAKPYANDAGKRALKDAFVRRGHSEVSIQDGATAGSFRVDGHDVRLNGTAPLVSILIPFRDRVDLTRACVESILSRSTYTAYELVLLDNGSTDPKTLAWLSTQASEPRVRIVRHEAPFNFSAINNAGARAASGEVLVLLNNDTEIVTPDWLERMLRHAVQKDIGCVGPLLLFPSGRVQHAGIVLGLGGTAGHLHRGALPEGGAMYSAIRSEANFSAVTGACMMVRKEVYAKSGGLDESLPVSWNDVDFCLRLRSEGLRHVYTGHVILTHKESESRGPDRDDQGRTLFLSRWSEQLKSDPYYSPHLTRDHEDGRF